MAERIQATLHTSDNHLQVSAESARVINAVSPTATVERVSGGAVLTVHDLSGTTSATLYDGAKGDKGDTGEQGPRGETGSVGPAGPRGETGATGQTGPQGAPGRDGVDGVSPTASVTQTATGATVIVTDAPGTTTATLTNGAPGQPGQDGEDGVGVPAGGTAGQVLAKVDGTDYNTQWTTPDPGGVTDVQVNETSVVSGGIAVIPMASGSTAGVVIIDTSNQTGIQVRNNKLMLRPAVLNDIKASWGEAKPLTPPLQNASTFYGLAKAAGDSTQSSSSNAVGQYTESAKSAISTMLNGFVSVSGTTPTITALPGIRYVCGEVSTLGITLPASGCIDVVFQSGSIATVLTVTPPTGVTLKWANGFDPTSLDANTTYEINVCDGLGVAGSWT